MSWLVLDASVISDVDLTAAETLIVLHDELDERGVELALVDLLADVQDLQAVDELVRSGSPS